MRVFVDATAASFGGLGTYASGLLRSWATEYPLDRLCVATAVGSSVSAQLTGLDVEVVRLGVTPERPVRRLIQQNLSLSRLSSGWHADVFLALLPQIPVGLRTPCVTFVYDLWHEVRPQDFTRVRRLQRRLLYSSAYRRSTAIAALSIRTHNDLLAAHPSLAGKVTTVLPGSDHVDGWSDQAKVASAPYLVAFGHHRNKRPDLAVDAWLRLRAEHHDLELVVCGLDTQQVRALRSRASPHGAQSGLTLRSYVPDAEFQVLLRGAAGLLFTSMFEGFGIPVLEAMRLGIPVVITPDAALIEAAGGHAFIASDWTADAVSVAAEAAMGAEDWHLRAAKEHACSFPWSRTAANVRSIALQVVDSLPPAE